MKIAKELAVELLYGDDDNFECVLETIEDHSRWSVGYRRVYKHLPTGKFYKTFYARGATESQDERPYEYDGDEIEFYEVTPVEKMVIVYE